MYRTRSTANLLALGEYQARGWEIKSHGRDLILTPPQPSATPLTFKRQRNNLYVRDVDINTVRDVDINTETMETMETMEPQELPPCSPPQPRANAATRMLLPW
jgi:hypothetical protein